MPIVPVRGGAEAASGIYKTFLIYRTCMRRAPAKPVRACILRKLCPVSHVTFEAPLRTSHCALRTPHFTLHCTLKTPHFTFPTHSLHFSLLTAFFILHTSHCTLHAPHFISSELFSPYPSSSLLISSILLCHLSFHEPLPSTTSKTCMRRAPARPVRACFVRSCCRVVVQEHDLRATPVQCNVKQTLSSHFTLRSSHPTPHTSHLHFISTRLIWALLISFHVFPYVS